jgi:serine/threonine protein kinase
MPLSPSIMTCKDKIIKYSSNNVCFFDDNFVYKQYSYKKFNWANEIFNVNSLNHPNIIKFNVCEIADDYVIDIKNKEICLDQTEKVVRITMPRYGHTLDALKDFNDYEIFYIITSIISAIVHCHKNSVLHRDIKEKNIFVNCNTSDENKRVLTDIVLADFNISKYKYKIPELNTNKIMTITHRSPEINEAIIYNNKITYDERVDVWSFCIIITYLITGKKFYNFLKHSYVKLMPNIMSDAEKIIIVLKHFLKIHEYKHLVHLNLYKKIIFMGIASYDNRCSISDILNSINDYNKKIQLYNIEIYNTEDIPFIYPAVLRVPYIYEIHQLLQNHDIILSSFNEFHFHISNNDFQFTHLYNVALYFIINIYVLDTKIPIETYIDIINTVSVGTISKKMLYVSIIQLIKYNNFFKKKEK